MAHDHRRQPKARIWKITLNKPNVIQVGKVKWTRACTNWQREVVRPEWQGGELDSSRDDLRHIDSGRGGEWGLVEPGWGGGGG